MSKQWNESTATAKGLYDPRYEHDNCGIGAVVNIKGIKTHETVENALKIVENLKHRAGKDADGKTGDGVGILLQISHKFFKKVTKPLGIELGDERDYGVGMFFFPNDEFKTIQAKKMLEVIVEKEGLEFLGWREVPTEPDKLSKKARDCMPCIMQCFVKRPEDVERGLEFDRKLYVARRVFEQSNDNTYVVSFSSRTIVYKGMFLVEQLRQFFMDYRILIMSQQSPQYIQDSLQIQTQAGRDLIRTDLSCTMVRLTLFLETLTRCQHVRRTWSLQSLKKSSRRFCRLSMRQDLTQQCLIMRLNSW
mgnify:CR=1 FL=1